MARMLGIDYGTRRIGLAVSDERGMMAFPYGVFDVSGMSKEQIIARIGDICAKERIDAIVLGVPHGLSRMQDTEMTDRAVSFGDTLKSLNLPIRFVEEFLSTKEASRAPTSKAKIDASAAALILQSYLDRRKDVLH